MLKSQNSLPFVSKSSCKKNFSHIAFGSLIQKKGCLAVDWRENLKCKSDLGYAWLSAVQESLIPNVWMLHLDKSFEAGQAPPTASDPCVPWLQQRPFQNLSLQVQWVALACFPSAWKFCFPESKEQWRQLKLNRLRKELCGATEYCLSNWNRAFPAEARA